MPPAALNRTAVARNAPPTATQPAGARVRAPEAARHDDAEAAHDRKAEQPAGLAAERRVQQAQRAGRAAEHVAAHASRPSRLPVHATEAVVFEDQRQDLVVTRARHPRAVGRRSQFDERRPRSADEHHRRTAREKLAQGVKPSACARGDPQPGRCDPRHDRQGNAHLRLKAQPDGYACEHEPARAPVLKTPYREPHRRHAAEHEQRIGVVVPRDPDGDRRRRERQACHEPAHPAKAAADEVIHERHARDAHQSLRHEHAQLVIAEDPYRQRLHPQRERRLVDRHHAALVKRREQEVVPARAHRAYGRAVVVVGPSVPRQRPQVQHAGQREKCGQLRPRTPRGERPRPRP